MRGPTTFSEIALALAFTALAFVWFVRRNLAERGFLAAYALLTCGLLTIALANTLYSRALSLASDIVGLVLTCGAIVALVRASRVKRRTTALLLGAVAIVSLVLFGVDIFFSPY
jgi:hypothetical protein